MNAANDLHITDPVAKMEELVREAEGGNDKAILTAHVVLANALIKGRPVDEDRLQRLAIRVGKHALQAVEDRIAGRHQTRMTWGSLLSACSDYIEHKQVPMHDGRCATAEGWNYENCEPECIQPMLPGELAHRLRNFMAEVTDATPGSWQYEEIFNGLVSRALGAYLDSTNAETEKAARE